MRLSIKKLKEKLEIMYLLLDAKGGQISQPSIITTFGEGSKETGKGHAGPGGCGGISPIDLFENRPYKRLHNMVRKLSLRYQRILRIRCTTNLKNTEIAEKQRIPLYMVNDILKEIYKNLRESLEMVT